MSDTGFELTKSPEKKAKKTFPGISPLAFEHPLDKAALSSLHKVPAIDKILRFVFRFVHEKRTRLDFLSSYVRVNERQFAFVNDLYEEALDILDIPERPELFIVQTPNANAFAYGVDKPFIAINSSLIDMMTPEELQTILAHELGHISAGHMLYVSVLHTLMDLLRVPNLLGSIPFGRLALQGFVMALFEWYRKAELTCDRAGLLVAQDIRVCHNVEMKLAGGKHTEHMNLEEFFKQAEEYEAEGDALDSVYKVMNNMYKTHPHAVARVKKLQEWYDTGNYHAILKGDYIRRDQGEDISTRDNWQEAINQVRDDAVQSEDPLAKAFTGVAESVMDAGQELFGRFFGGPGDSHSNDSSKGNKN